jgi:uncharacterized protein
MEYNSKFLDSIKWEGYINQKVILKEAPGKGKGLFANAKISKGEIVSISGGIIVQAENWESFKQEFGDYAYFIEENFLIAPLNPEKPSADWMMNHCCEPNCGVKGQIVFVALRDIEAGEELLYDYAMTETDPEYKMDLRCEQKTCRKKLTGNDWKLPDLQQKYDGHFSLYIQEKIISSKS